ncbi:hypothetical protein [Microbacterium aurantiacum]|uniref:hypothetical protein n=1 Tax=Microbacterium aurantiacum TaxID=162393 RepID=UPI0007DA69F9|nr:hypothetical protein [Microbacterium chocolatum]ANG86870.1 hypothetical protein A8L33_14960 [Microbacterium chocolatum]
MCAGVEPVETFDDDPLGQRCLCDASIERVLQLVNPDPSVKDLLPRRDQTRGGERLQRRDESQPALERN